MIVALILLALLPLLGLVLWLLKAVLKLSFSVGKILLIAFIIWLIYAAVSGTLTDTLGNIGKHEISEKDGVIRYVGVFSSEPFDPTALVADDYTKIEMNSVFSDIKVTVPHDTVMRIQARGAVSEIGVNGAQETLWAGSKSYVAGSGSRIVEIVLNGAFTKVTFIE